MAPATQVANTTCRRGRPESTQRPLDRRKQTPTAIFSATTPTDTRVAGSTTAVRLRPKGRKQPLPNGQSAPAAARDLRHLSPTGRTSGLPRQQSCSSVSAHTAPRRHSLAPPGGVRQPVSGPGALPPIRMIAPSSPRVRDRRAVICGRAAATPVSVRLVALFRRAYMVASAAPVVGPDRSGPSDPRGRSLAAGNNHVTDATAESPRDIGSVRPGPTRYVPLAAIAWGRSARRASETASACGAPRRR